MEVLSIDEPEGCVGDKDLKVRTQEAGSVGPEGRRPCRPEFVTNATSTCRDMRLCSSKTRDRAHMSSTSRTVRSTTPNWHDPAHSADEHHVMQ